MSSYGEYCAISARAGADLSGKLYHIARWSAEGVVNIASNAAATYLLGPMGVIFDKVYSGHQVPIVTRGEAKVIAGGALTANTAITCNGSGRAAAAGSGDICIGRVLETAGADGDQVRALINEPYRFIGT